MVENYDRQYLFPILLKCCHVFCLLLEFEIMVDSLNDDSCFDILEMIVKNGDVVKELVNKGLQMF
jgi:hypothetical protein